MKKSAELGLVDAQHNLGCIYNEGKIVKKDQLKALAWFTHAGSGGFSASMYNAAKIFLEGSECKRIKRNLQAGLVWLEGLQKTG